MISVAVNLTFKKIFCMYNIGMDKKAVTKKSLQDSEVSQNLEYWLSKTPQERVEAVEILRRQMYGSSERLQRVARIIQRSQDK